MFGTVTNNLNLTAGKKDNFRQVLDKKINYCFWKCKNSFEFLSTCISLLLMYSFSSVGTASSPAVDLILFLLTLSSSRCLRDCRLDTFRIRFPARFSTFSSVRLSRPVIFKKEDKFEGVLR